MVGDENKIHRVVRTAGAGECQKHKRQKLFKFHTMHWIGYNNIIMSNKYFIIIMCM